MNPEWKDAILNGSRLQEVVSLRLSEVHVQIVFVQQSRSVGLYGAKNLIDCYCYININDSLGDDKCSFHSI